MLLTKTAKGFGVDDHYCYLPCISKKIFILSSQKIIHLLIEPMCTKFLDSLSRDFGALLTDTCEEYNVTILAGQGENEKVFHAHSLVLRARSPYFRTALSSDWVKRENGCITFCKPNISPNVFELILE